MSRLFALMVLSVWLMAGCAAPRNFSAQTVNRSPHAPKVWVVSNGFHTSVALRAQDCPAAVQAVDRKARYFVIGWGGRDFYQGLVRYPWDYARTVLLPTPSTLHVIPIHTDLLRECPRAAIIEFDVTPSGLEALRDRLSMDFKRDAEDHLIIDGRGRLPLSHFYKGTETYFIPKTCNVWTAARLKLAGVPMTAGAAISADILCWQAARQGRVLTTWQIPREVL